MDVMEGFKLIFDNMEDLIEAMALKEAFSKCEKCDYLKHLMVIENAADNYDKIMGLRFYLTLQQKKNNGRRFVIQK